MPVKRLTARMWRALEPSQFEAGHVAHDRGWNIELRFPAFRNSGPDLEGFTALVVPLPIIAPRQTLKL